MKPTLLLLSGPPGIGKSTLAQRYADTHPLALNLDIDHIWWMMGSWQEYRPQSSTQKFELAYSMAQTHLAQGYDVVVAQDLSDARQYERFETIAKSCGAVLCEVLLIAPLEEAIERCKERSRRSGYPTGFRPGGILEAEDKEAKLTAMYREMMQAASQRPNTHVIESVNGSPDHTYAQLEALLPTQ